MTGQHDAEPAIQRWVAGQLPEWAVVTPRRYAHVQRVGTLLDRWAVQRGLDESGRRRWRLAGLLHDAVRDAPPERIRPWIDDPKLRALPGSFLHGPAAAARVAADGLHDDELLDAIRYHTLGHPAATELGLALLVADALEPGRARHAAWRAALRARMPDALDEVACAVVREKLERALAAGRWLRPEMIALWNRLAARLHESAH